MWLKTPEHLNLISKPNSPDIKSRGGFRTPDSIDGGGVFRHVDDPAALAPEKDACLTIRTPLDTVSAQVLAIKSNCPRVNYSSGI